MSCITVWNKGLTEYEIVQPAKVTGHPIPDNEEAMEYWMDMAERDLNKCLFILSTWESHSENLAVWANKILKAIEDNCNI